MSKFFGYFVSSLFEITLGFLIGLAALLALALVMFWPLLVWDLDSVVIYPAIVVNSIVLISLLFAYMETKADEGG
jgi:cadmium resistance protein CadD (predicted permease)